MSDWRPIETAPKNGSTVQLLIPYNRSLFSEAECTDRGFWEPLSPFDRDQGANIGLPQWVLDGGGCWRFEGDDGEFDIQPTHWKAVEHG